MAEYREYERYKALLRDMVESGRVKPESEPDIMRFIIEVLGM